MLLTHFFKFWYQEGLTVFLRLWTNILALIEEDLAVVLMFKLILTPLFHDSSFFGRVLSFFFRLSRIIFGLFAMLFLSCTIFAISLIWFLTPPLILLLFSTPFFGIDYLITLRISPGFPLSNLVILSSVIFNFGLALYINHIINRPLKKIWQIKSSFDIFRTTHLAKKDVNWDYLKKTDEVKNLKELLEIEHLEFAENNLPLDEQVLNKAFELAKNSQAKYLTAGYFWLAFLSQTPNIQNELLKFNLKLEDFEGALKFLEKRRNHWRKSFIWDDDFSVKHLKGINRGWLSAPTPALNEVSDDLTKKASKGEIPDFVGRDGTLREVINILSQNDDRNVLIVGDTGTGKTALVEYLAKMIVRGDAPPALATKRVVKIDLVKLVADLEGEGMVAKRIRNVFEEVENIEDCIVFINEIHNLGLGEIGDRYNLYELLIPYFESNKFQFIASTERENYERIVEKNLNLVKIFQKVELIPATTKETIEIIEDRVIDLSKGQGLQLTFLAIKEIVELSSKLVHEKVLPDSALSILEASLPEAKFGWIKAESVKKVMSRRINVPIEQLDEAGAKELLSLEDQIHKQLIDQSEAVKKVSDALIRSATALKDESRPIGSFLFVGPTGVGKTELAKILSKIYFKHTGAYLRYDMSEYQTTDSIHRLIGTISEPGELTEAVKAKPFALILLDEFEKADPKLLTIFLQVLEDGRLTDGRGKVVDFTNTIIIATSNASSITIAEGLKNGKTLDKLNSEVRVELLKIFRPELLNRFDEVVMFKPLSTEDLEKIVKIKLEGLKAMLKEEGYLVEFDDSLVGDLAKRGYDPSMGARPLRRLIQETLETKLSRKILEKEITKGEVYKVSKEIFNPDEIKLEIA
ncbi:MAG: hypothetical protein ACD_30C00035G0002 [uncultured bacterium]|uniref:Sigma-54 factor interaction domain-containing protein n=4 Tax=Microgenomates group TaxID=1794810 RepID=A0A1F5K4V1_9BACT|nr:MAG: hypothetical protein ACD_30C00035G0002 [uncultured bacterium]KKQ16145.1 MAG: Negative regulator of genetic competence ClpC/mecB [Candidatus Daviesbacteria bacterium GW2011_GWA1_36_8]KKQ75788.1 MAG: Negative regulator of genetic competence ClpC/mecB [Candidatus Woesebacteria bacterium GW2011_GWB1_38_5b]OGE16810.1 MAG: hypothetical protein A2858_02810 [Candidatus Daviesbacteria bacterium RIFCSPHIGHO2_01_FULL_36_37]OGE35798.1 MAG: hypothetical protein A3E66_00695 [Candidatus Daviesbacteria